jgi:hypothetical protein
VGFLGPALGTPRAPVAPIVKRSCLRVNQNLGRRNSQGRPSGRSRKA